MVLKLGSGGPFGVRETNFLGAKTTILKKKFCVKLSFQATFLPISLTNTICHETLQATWAFMISQEAIRCHISAMAPLA